MPSVLAGWGPGHARKLEPHGHVTRPVEGDQLTSSCLCSIPHIWVLAESCPTPGPGHFCWS